MSRPVRPGRGGFLPRLLFRRCGAPLRTSTPCFLRPSQGGFPNWAIRTTAFSGFGSWRNILRHSLAPEEQLQDYFALCLACHHATVATFVPTDVDTKIRGIVWRESRDPDVLRPMLRLALSARAWTEEGISVRSVRGVSGHNGEHWSAIAGGLGRMVELGDTTSADEALAAIEAEIDRERRIFDETVAERGAELDLLRLSMTLVAQSRRSDARHGLLEEDACHRAADGASHRTWPIRAGRSHLSTHWA